MKEQTQFSAFQNSANPRQYTSDSVTLGTWLQLSDTNVATAATKAAPVPCNCSHIPLPHCASPFATGLRGEGMLPAPATQPRCTVLLHSPSQSTPQAEVLYMQGQLYPVAPEAKSSFEFQTVWPSLDTMCPSLSPDTHLLCFQGPVRGKAFLW